MHQFNLGSGNLNSDKSANSKFIFDHSSEIYFSIDTGQSENILSKHNFDLNERHINNDLLKMKPFDEVVKNHKADITISGLVE